MGRQGLKLGVKLGGNIGGFIRCTGPGAGRLPGKLHGHAPPLILFTVILLLCTCFNNQISFISVHHATPCGCSEAGVYLRASHTSSACGSLSVPCASQASAKLKQAEALGSPAERDSLVREAVAQLMTVPLSCNLEYLVSQLAYLRHYEVQVFKSALHLVSWTTTVPHLYSTSSAC